MASAKVSLGVSPKMKGEETEMVIVGGGICGILAAKQCHDRGMKYVVIEKEAKLGGVWHTMANSTSFLQVSPFFFYPKLAICVF
jgi:cation diffusion facilitator CzcD-associated flavoprotein CzcO